MVSGQPCIPPVKPFDPPLSMKLDPTSLLFSVSKTLPMSAVLLFFAPTVVSAQVGSTPIVPPPPTVTSSPATATTAIGSQAQVSATTPTGTTASVQPVSQLTATPAAIQSVPATPIAQTAIANPTQAFPIANPQLMYPVAPPMVYPTAQAYPVAPVANPGGFSVQVTTQIGIPNQAGYPQASYPQAGYSQPSYPQVGYPQAGYPQAGYPVGVPNSGSYGIPVYPGNVYGSNGQWQPGLNGGYSEAIANPALLPLSAQTVWQQVVSTSSQTTAQNVAALQQMVRDYPNFIPAYVQLAQALVANNRTQEAISVLERGTTLYPNQPELARSLIVALGNSNRWNEASMAARQFAIRNPNSSLANEFTKLADESSKLAQTPSLDRPRSGSLLGNLLTSGLGYLLTGRVSSPVAPSTPWSSPFQNNAANGSQMAQELLNRVQLVNDTEVVNYINEIGRKLGQASGRNDFQFYVVNDRDSGAIALPGGKVFVSAGAIANTNSETELATLIARQMGHATLAHPDRLAKRGNITSTITRLLPAVGGLINPRVNSFNNSTMGTLVSGLMGNLANGLLKPNYTTQMVKDADRAGAKLLETAGYGQTNLISISTGDDRHSQVRAKVQQLLGTGQSWWSSGR